MTTRSAKRSDLEVHLGSSAHVVGRLYLGNGRRSAFSYNEAWLQDGRFFMLSPDLQSASGIQYPQNTFFLALEDTAPDSWGERVIRRAHAKLRQENRDLSALEQVDFLMWVDDEARVGALRLFDPQKKVYLRSGNLSRHVPPLLELDRVLQAARALEDGTESKQDLQYLLGQGTSLGGARPKSTVRDTDGRLALGKFPSQSDRRDAIHTYTELVDVLLQEGANPIADIHQLWRRLAFNFLICNTDDHLRNTGFLYDARNHGWRLAPAFDLNPMPGDRRESKTWLTENSGPIDSRAILLDGAPYFRLTVGDAEAIWAELVQAVSRWRSVAKGLGMQSTDLVDFEPAFA